MERTIVDKTFKIKIANKEILEISRSTTQSLSMTRKGVSLDKQLLVYIDPESASSLVGAAYADLRRCFFPRDTISEDGELFASATSQKDPVEAYMILEGGLSHEEIVILIQQLMASPGLVDQNITTEYGLQQVERYIKKIRDQAELAKNTKT